jgi:hypothetical protein
VHIDDEHNDQLWKSIQKISYCFETREKKLNYYLGKQFKIKENENEC